MDSLWSSALLLPLTWRVEKKTDTQGARLIQSMAHLNTTGAQNKQRVYLAFRAFIKWNKLIEFLSDGFSTSPTKMGRYSSSTEKSQQGLLLVAPKTQHLYLGSAPQPSKRAVYFAATASHSPHMFFTWMVYSIHKSVQVVCKWCKYHYICFLFFLI